MNKLFPWQTMDSAPRDGTVILALLNSSDIPYPVRWVKFKVATASSAPGGAWIMPWEGYSVRRTNSPRLWMALPPSPGEG